MLSSGSGRLGRHRSRAAGVLLMLVPVVASSCGGSGTRGATQTSAGTGVGAGASTAGAGGASGEGAGLGASGQVSSAGSNAGTGAGGLGLAGGGQAEGGAPEAGGEGAGGAAEGTLGIECDGATCTIGQACVFCVTESSSGRICMPHPESDPSGYAAASAACASQPTQRFDDCDGPEDCEPAQFCVAREGADAFMRCREMPSIAHSCCFTCGALADCTICRNDQQCPEGEACSRVVDVGIKGCVVAQP